MSGRRKGGEEKGEGRQRRDQKVVRRLKRNCVGGASKCTYTDRQRYRRCSKNNRQHAAPRATVTALLPHATPPDHDTTVSNMNISDTPTKTRRL